MKPLLVEVAVEAPLPHFLTYKWPENLAEPQNGLRVSVPLGRRKANGVIVSIPTGESKLAANKIKSVDKIFEGYPIVGPKTLQWLKWLAQYYAHPPGQVYSLVFPKDLMQAKRKTSKRAVVKSNSTEALEAPLVLNSYQKNAVDRISESMAAKKFDPFLLYGVTGSGKTEVYLQAIKKNLDMGLTSIVLVPEISLTPQMTT
jgi:primosomal protein N' (replication factor Y)